MIENFVKINREFWSDLKFQQGGQKLLVEELNHPSVSHTNAYYALVLSQARGYVPVWLDLGRSDSPDFLKIIQSYVPGARVILTKIRPWYKKAAVFVEAAIRFIPILLTGDVLSFRYDGVKYGDILYDVYLTMYGGRATIKFPDPRLIRTIGSIIFRHREIRGILKSDNFAGVLGCHQVGVDGGVMFRVALRYGYLGFLVGTSYQPECFSSPDDVYDMFQGRPMPEDVDRIIARLGGGVAAAFEKELGRQVGGFEGRGGNDPYAKSHRFYTDRAAFNRDFNLDSGKKNVFVMLHSFNDHPRSHFRWMLFKDYYDWFYQTLRFAKRHPEVNWVFKQHPMVKYYPMKHVKVAKLFQDAPSNVVFIDENRQIDTRSLIACADLVVTCLGSAGFELPAMGGIPSLTAGDNFYTNLGFAREPKTKQEYFGILGRAAGLGRLSPAQQQRAQAAYLYIYKYSRPGLAVIPELSVQEDHDIANINNWYWDKIAAIYGAQSGAVRREFNELVEVFKDPEFKRFSRIND